MNGPTGSEVTYMIASEAERSANAAARTRYEAADIIKGWIPDPSDTAEMSPAEMSKIITDLVAAVRVLSGLPAYETPSEHFRRTN